MRITRLDVEYLGAPLAPHHQEFLRRAAWIFERFGNPVELGMTLMMQGFYAIGEGRLRDLQAIAKSLRDLTRVSQERDQ